MALRWLQLDVFEPILIYWSSLVCTLKTYIVTSANRLYHCTRQQFIIVIPEGSEILGQVILIPYHMNYIELTYEFWTFHGKPWQWIYKSMGFSLRLKHSSDNKLKSVTDCETMIYKLRLWWFKAVQEIKRCLSSSTFRQLHNWQILSFRQYCHIYQSQSITVQSHILT